jgi:hypothetical protein
MRKVTTRGFPVTRSPGVREAVIDGRIQSDHRLYHLWTAGSEEPEASDDSPIQNGSSRLLISQRFLPRSVPNRRLQGALRTKRFFRASVPNIALSRVVGQFE